ncbi:hypothetical protein BH11PLA1_BH11PLA1_12380 [soil metagenome]
MSCNCGCHDDKPPAQGWKRFVPIIIGAAVAAALVAGATLKDSRKATAPGAPHTEQTTSAARR